MVWDEDNPTPEDRAEFVVKKLEQMIRDKKEEKGEGMSFAEWQDMAKDVIAEAVRDAEQSMHYEDRFLNRMIITGGTALVTIGFWGAAVSINDAFEMTASVVCAIAGFTLFAIAFEWGGRRVSRRVKKKRRAKSWAKIVTMDQRIKRMRRENTKKIKELEKELDAQFGKRSELIKSLTEKRKNQGA